MHIVCESIIYHLPEKATMSTSISACQIQGQPSDHQWSFYALRNCATIAQQTNRISRTARWIRSDRPSYLSRKRKGMILHSWASPYITQHDDRCPASHVFPSFDRPNLCLPRISTRQSQLTQTLPSPWSFAVPVRKRTLLLETRETKMETRAWNAKLSDLQSAIEAREDIQLDRLRREKEREAIRSWIHESTRN